MNLMVDSPLWNKLIRTRFIYQIIIARYTPSHSSSLLLLHYSHFFAFLLIQSENLEFISQFILSSVLWARERERERKNDSQIARQIVHSFLCDEWNCITCCFLLGTGQWEYVWCVAADNLILLRLCFHVGNEQRETERTHTYTEAIFVKSSVFSGVYM